MASQTQVLPCVDELGSIWTLMSTLLPWSPATLDMDSEAAATEDFHCKPGLEASIEVPFYHAYNPASVGWVRTTQSSGDPEANPQTLQVSKRAMGLLKRL